MRALIQVRGRPGRGSAQPSSTPSKSRLTVTVKRSERTVRASRAEHVKAVERDDAAHLRLDPIERRILRVLRHGKDAAGIGLEQHFRRDLDEGGFAIGHADGFRKAPLYG